MTEDCHFRWSSKSLYICLCPVCVLGGCAIYIGQTGRRLSRSQCGGRVECQTSLMLLMLTLDSDFQPRACPDILVYGFPAERSDVKDQL